ncbi:MAG: hypothetical protein OSA38_00845 [Candidatus Poseidoniaceae archaeon]|nr:hypothetical protein [Candidatus Poseidoniaceae archaeon]|tara:strand:- start:747 stop:1577 length:831 start_codon:yes stop_codon:yes gene_type:complete
MRTQTLRPMLLGAVLLAAMFAGCLDGAEDEAYDGPIDFIAYYEVTSGTILESIQNNQQVSEDGVDVAFDLSYTKSSKGLMSTFWFNAGDGSNTVTVNAADTGEVTYTYLTHGMFSAAIGATDDLGNEYYENITIRIDKQITWADTNTVDPRTMNIDVTPDCVCQLAEQIQIDSTVENIENGFNFGGSPVTVTWYLNNSEGEAVVESPPEQIADGQNANWQHNEFAPATGTWTLDVGLSQDQERVDIDHLVTIAYAAEESTSNPFPTDEEVPEDEGN